MPSVRPVYVSTFPSSVPDVCSTCALYNTHLVVHTPGIGQILFFWQLQLPYTLIAGLPCCTAGLLGWGGGLVGCVLLTCGGLLGSGCVLVGCWSCGLLICWLVGCIYIYIYIEVFKQDTSGRVLKTLEVELLYDLSRKYLFTYIFHRCYNTVSCSLG